MGHLGHVRNGAIVLDPGATLSEGSRVFVQVHVLDLPCDSAPPHVDVEVPTGPRGPTASEIVGPFENWGQLILKFAGTMNDLPEDYSENHERYVRERSERSERQ